MAYKGKNYSVKLRKYYFCTTTRIVNPMLRFQSFQSANNTLKGIETMNMIRKGQVNDLNYSVFNEVKYINKLFGLVL
jgi:transposase, IS6 family